MSLTLRQLQGILAGPLFWLIIATSVGLAALAGPYYTLERLSFPERLVYWGTTISLSAVIMTFLSIYAYRLSDGRGWNWAIVSLLAGFVGVLPVVASIYFAEGVAAGFAPGWYEGVGFWRLTGYTVPSVVAVTMVVNTAIQYQNDNDDPVAPSDAAQPMGNPTLLQSKLPHHLGTDIVSVRAQDHYVEVTTPLGSAMVLMRLSDAIQDLAQLNGLQVHRSWWVSLNHVARTEKGPNGPEIVLSTDQEVPVGRSFRKAYRAATGE